MEPGFELKEKVSALSEAILSKHPTMKSLLREIHTTVSKYPEQITLLSEDEISKIVQGLMVTTGIEFAEKAIKAPASKTKAIKSMGASAF
jgi:hypothetical protein